MRYRVVETSDVTAEGLEQILNEWTARGWRFDGINFVVKESARRPTLAFVRFVRDENTGLQTDESPPGTDPARAGERGDAGKEGRTGHDVP